MAKNNGPKTQVIDKFRTINTNVIPDRLKEDELVMAMNCLLKTDGTIEQRDGSELVEDVGYDSQLFIFNEIRGGDVYEQLLSVGGTNIEKYNDGTDSFDSISSTLSNSSVWSGLSFIGSFILSNGTNVYRYWYNTSAYQLDDITSTSNLPKAMLWEEYDNAIYCCKDGTENIYWSNPGDPLTWDAYNFIALSAKPTALKRIGEFLFVGTNRGLYKIESTGDSLVPYKLSQITNAYIVENSIVEVKSGVVGCLTKEGRLLVFDQFAQSGSQVDDSLGFPVENFLGTIEYDNADLFWSYYDRTQGVTLFGINTINGYIDDTTNEIQTQMVLNKDTFGWSLWDMPMRSYAIYKGDRFYSDCDGHVLKFNVDLYQDNSVEFNTYIITPVYTFGRTDLHKNFRSMFMVTTSTSKTEIGVEYAAAMTLLYPYDLSQLLYATGGVYGSGIYGSMTYGGGTYNQTNRQRLDVNGKGIQLKFSRAMENADFQIQSFLFDYLMSYRRGSNIG